MNRTPPSIRSSLLFVQLHIGSLFFPRPPRTRLPSFALPRVNLLFRRITLRHVALRASRALALKKYLALACRRVTEEERETTRLFVFGDVRTPNMPITRVRPATRASECGCAGRALYTLFRALHALLSVEPRV